MTWWSQAPKITMSRYVLLGEGVPNLGPVSHREAQVLAAPKVSSLLLKSEPRFCFHLCM